MTLESSFTVLLASIVLAGCSPQQPGPLKPADLRVSRVGVDDDSTSVRQHLGPPRTVDSTGWHYADLNIWMAHGKVAILSLTGPSLATSRGLRVGDPAARASSLYHPCYADSTIVQICYNTDDFDSRAVIAALKAGAVTRISIGRIIEP